MGSCIRWLFTHGSTIIHDCLRLSPCSDERRTNYMAILSPAIPSYHTTIFHIHDTIQHLTNVVGTDKRRDIINGSITNFLELPDTCRTSVVYVSSNQSLSIHTYNISMAEKSLGKRRTLLHRVVSVINMHPISQPLVWLKYGDNVSGTNITCYGTSQAIWVTSCWHIIYILTLRGVVQNASS